MSKSNIWIHFSDLMTGLMVIFLFIAIAYIRKVQQNTNVLSEYVEVKTQLHDKMVREFAGDTARWQMTIGKDLSMKFTKPEVLFQTGKAEITPQFRDILDEFIPKYLDILLNDSLRSKIKEIRIEGHTDNIPAPRFHTDPYMGNVILSQRRANEVLWYIRNMECFSKYTEEERSLLEYWFTANGLSYGKALDNTGEYVYISKEPINLDRSRRVEFRIVTSGEEVLENFVEKQ